jgi:hypothetical protein
LGPISNNTETIDAANINYPTAASLPAGFVPLTRSVTPNGGRGTALDDGDHDGDHGENSVSSLMRRNHGGSLYLDHNGVSIPRYSIPVHELEITVTLPDETCAMVDFGPHGTQFDRPVTVRISLEGYELPEGVVLEELTIFYVNENGEWEMYNGTLNSSGNWLDAQTDHFSRYIISRRA